MPISNARPASAPPKPKPQRAGSSATLRSFSKTPGSSSSYPFLESILQDLGHALRQLRRNPTFSLTVLFILALGIGASTAVFTVVDGVLFRPAPYADPDRIVAYGITAPIETREFLFGFGYLYWQGKIPAFEAVTSMFPGDQDCDLTETNPARLTCVRVESTLLPMFGVRPVIGRNFTRDEDRPHSASWWRCSPTTSGERAMAASQRARPSHLAR